MKSIVCILFRFAKSLQQILHNIEFSVQYFEKCANEINNRYWRFCLSPASGIPRLRAISTRDLRAERENAVGGAKGRQCHQQRDGLLSIDALECKLIQVSAGCEP